MEVKASACCLILVLVSGSSCSGGGDFCLLLDPDVGVGFFLLSAVGGADAVWSKCICCMCGRCFSHLKLGIMVQNFLSCGHLLDLALLSSILGRGM